MASLWDAWAVTFLENKFQLIKVSIVNEDKIDRFEKHYLAIENYY